MNASRNGFQKYCKHVLLFEIVIHVGIVVDELRIRLKQVELQTKRVQSTRIYQTLWHP